MVVFVSNLWLMYIDIIDRCGPINKIHLSVTAKEDQGNTLHVLAVETQLNYKTVVNLAQLYPFTKLGALQKCVSDLSS